MHAGAVQCACRRRGLLGRERVLPPFADLHLARSYAQRNLHGCVVIAPRDEYSTVDFLQQLYSNVGKDMTSVLIEATREGDVEYHQMWNFRVSTAKLRTAYTFLRRNNPLYEHIDISKMLDAIDAMNKKDKGPNLGTHVEQLRSIRRQADDALNGNGAETDDGSDASDDPLDYASVGSADVSDDDTETAQVFSTDDPVARYGRLLPEKIRMYTAKKINSTMPDKLRDVDCKGFPTLFPYGPPGLRTCSNLTPHDSIRSRAEYLKARLCSVNPMCASCTSSCGCPFQSSHPAAHRRYPPAISMTW